ncbi:ABC transporter substrate-binding protein [Dactylosporangium sp. NPDC048998]|uniref:ABC transporter substrate-binding protein n=1 Tax=Dactylosporangium sp. NPDC048998 TaxID=3363976 RepID=UPI00372423E0
MDDSSFRAPMSRRAVLGGGVAAAAAMALAACSSGGGASSKSGAPIKFWNMQWGGQPFTDAAKSITSSYKPAAGLGGVNYQSVPWTNWYQTFMSAAASKTTPAVSDGAAFLPYLFLEQGIGAPADDLVDLLNKRGENDFLPGVLEGMKTKNGYAAVPWAMDLRVLWYRKSILEKAGAEVPTDWDSFIAAGTALKKIGAVGLGMAASAAATDAHVVFALMFNNGGGFFAEDGTPDCVTDRNIETLDFMNELVRKGIIDPRAASYTPDNLAADWQSGHVAMGWDQVSMNSRLTGDAATDAVVASPIAGPHGDKATAYWVNPIWMFKTTPSQKSSEEFTAYYLSQIHKYWEMGLVGDLPVKKSIIDLPIVQNNANLVKSVKEWQPIGKTIAAKASVPFGGLVAVDGGSATTTFVGQIVQGTTPSNKMLKDLQAGLEKELAKAKAKG